MTNNILFDDLRHGNGYDVAVCSGIGKRESQQDCAYCYAGDASVYAVVCDGMGGLGGGAQASRAAAQVAAECWKRRLGGGMAAGCANQGSNWMADAILEADRAVYAIRDASGRRMGAGSTFVSVWLQERRLFWSSVGDSRVYLFRGEEAVQATTDLNYYYILDQKRADGQLTEEDYQREAVAGESLISFCGLGDLTLVDRNTEALLLEPGDVVLLCSDGLYRTIDPDWMRDILTACDSMEEAAKYIPTIIEEYGSKTQDNYTGVLIQLKK